MKNVQLTFDPGEASTVSQKLGISNERKAELTLFIKGELETPKPINEYMSAVWEFAKTDNEFTYLMYSLGARIGRAMEKASNPLNILSDLFSGGESKEMCDCPLCKAKREAAARSTPLATAGEA